jgi:hypothetical protein
LIAIAARIGERFLRRGGGIDDRPCDRADIEPGLSTYDPGIGVRCVGPARLDTVKPRRQIGNQEQPAEFRVRGALFRPGEDGVEDDGVTGARDAYGLISQAVIDFFGYFRSTSFGRQVSVF